MIALRDEYNAQALPRVQAHVEELDQLRAAQLEAQLRLLADDATLNAKRRRIDHIFNEYKQWIKDTLETEPVPFIQVVAAFVAAT
jgi:vacuolar-type H+-ATPase subunit E/Vma4